jgi:extracellular factor (EF) 3-hydroxypalmitic acid methyl ester biosynthesis protein
MNSNPLILKKGLAEKDTEFIKYLIAKGGPELQDYKEFTSIVDHLEHTDIEEFRENIVTILNKNSLIGHAFVKPFGYPGDFNLIYKIYQFDVSEDPRFINWDIFFQNQPAANAVRNRKNFFIEYCKNLALRKKNAKVLILGSGPAEDVNEFLTNYSGDNTISFELIDFDQCAINFSMEKNENFNGQITYNKINALRFNSYKLYDLIWSAGLFDYFKDKHFTFLLRKYFNCITEDGEMVISNFSTKNPTRRFMEVIDWNLNHRTESDLFRVASDANIDKEMVSAEKEPLGINLFLKIKKTQ